MVEYYGLALLLANLRNTKKLHSNFLCAKNLLIFEHMKNGSIMPFIHTLQVYGIQAIFHIKVNESSTIGLLLLQQ